MASAESGLGRVVCLAADFAGILCSRPGWRLVPSTICQFSCAWVCHPHSYLWRLRKRHAPLRNRGSDYARAMVHCLRAWTGSLGRAHARFPECWNAFMLCAGRSCCHLNKTIPRRDSNDAQHHSKTLCWPWFRHRPAVGMDGTTCKRTQILTWPTHAVTASLTAPQSVAYPS